MSDNEIPPEQRADPAWPTADAGPRADAPRGHPARVLAILVIVAGAILAGAGAATYIVVAHTLAQEKITVSDDADHFAGQDVNDPFTAYAQAQVIQKHALKIGGGKTYSELPQDDPNRNTVMTASFLRASLFTSVVAFGVALLRLGAALRPASAGTG